MAFTAPPIRNSVMPRPVYGDPGNISEFDLMTGQARTIPSVEPQAMSGGLQQLGNQDVTTSAPQPTAPAVNVPIPSGKPVNRRRAKLAEALGGKLIGEASDTSPTPLWGGIARLGEGLMGGYMAGRAADRQDQADRAALEGFNQLLASGKGTGAEWARIAADPNSTEGMRTVAGAYLASDLKGNQTDDIKEWQAAVAQGYKGNLQDWILSQKKAGAMVIGGGSDKQIFDAMDARSQAAQAASRGLDAITQARAAINAPGGMIAGAAANDRLSLQKVGALFGVADTSAIQNTETFRSAIAPQVAAMIKAAVGTNNISNTDREFAEKATGGDIRLDEGTIRRLLNIMETSSAKIIDSFNKQIDLVYPEGQGFDRERAIFGGMTRGPTQFEIEQELRRRGALPQ